MSEKWVVKTLDVRGTKYNVHLVVWGETHSFETYFGETHVADTSIKGLKAKLMKLTKAKTVKVAVPFYRERVTRVRDDSIHVYLEKGVAISIHQGTNNVIVKWEERRETEQLSYYGKFLSGDMPGDAMMEYVDIRAQILKLEYRLNKILEAHLIPSLKRLVEEAIEDKVAKDKDK